MGRKRTEARKKGRKEGTYFARLGDGEERIDMAVRVMLLWVRALRNLFLINDFLFFVSLRSESFVSIGGSAVWEVLNISD